MLGGSLEVQFTGNQESSGPPKSELTYMVFIRNAGKYKLAIRGLEAPLESGQDPLFNVSYVMLYQVNIATLCTAD